MIFQRKAVAYVLDIVFPHGLNKVGGAKDVVCIVQPGLLDAFPNSLAPGKVNDCVKSAASISEMLFIVPIC